MGVLQVVFAGLVCGLGLAWRERELAAPLGLAALVVLATWGLALHVPLVLLGLAAIVLAILGCWRAFQNHKPSLTLTSALLVLSAIVPALLLAVVLGALDVPVSTHDGAFHVETVDALRSGQPLQTWYPLGFHASAAAVLALVPWVDTARGTPELAQGLALLAPLTVFGVGRAIGLRALEAAAAALVLSLTFVYPYDFQLWAGWPLGASVLLMLGAWSVAVRWIERPSRRLAALGGGLAGAMLLTHGTEVYTLALALLPVLVVRGRRIQPRALAVDLPLAACAAVAVCLPYVPTLLHWAGGGGASSVGAGALDPGTSALSLDDSGWQQFVFGAVGGATALDLVPRLGLLALGIASARVRLLSSVWLVFVAVDAALSFLTLPGLDTVFVLTYPWLAGHRLREIAVVFASLLIGAGLLDAAARLRRLRLRTARPVAWRRMAIAAVVALSFLAEGSGISIYKRLAAVAADQNVYSSDDRAAMTWLRQHAQPGQLLVNDGAADAGIWAPYKAAVPILLPRSASGDEVAEREPILDNVGNLGQASTTRTVACRLNVHYVYAGALELDSPDKRLPDRARLEQAADLEEVFRSGDAAVFRVRLPCG